MAIELRLTRVAPVRGDDDPARQPGCCSPSRACCWSLTPGPEPAVPRLAHAVPGPRGRARVARRHDDRIRCSTSLAAALGLSAVFVAVPGRLRRRALGRRRLPRCGSRGTLARPHGSGGSFARARLPRGGAGDAVPRRRRSPASSIPRSRCSSSRSFRSSSIRRAAACSRRSLVLGATQIVIAVVGDSLFVLAAAGVARWLADAPGCGRVVAALGAGRRVRGARRAARARRPAMTRATRSPSASTRKLALMALIWGGTFIGGRIASARDAAVDRGAVALRDRDRARCSSLAFALERGLPRLSRAAVARRSRCSARPASSSINLLLHVRPADACRRRAAR